MTTGAPRKPDESVASPDPIAAPPEEGGAAGPRLDAHRWRELLSRYGTILFVLGVMTYFTLAASGDFLTFGNLRNVAVAVAPLAVLAAGLTVCLVAGDFDLSIANNAILAAVVAARIAVDNDTVFWAFSAGIGTALAVGFLNGLVVTKLGVNPFIATLAMGLFILQGLGFVLSDTGTISSGLPEGFNAIGNDSFLGIRILLWVAVGTLVVLWVVLKHTELGRRMDAVGGNPSASRLAGIRLDRTRIAAFAISGLCAGVCGVLLASEFNIANANGQGTLLLDAFTAAFIGSATLSAGRFHIVGTAFGALVLGMLTNGMTLVGVSSDYQSIYKGAILIGAVAFAALGRTRQ